MTGKFDADLVALARAGDKPAFGQLVERHRQMVKHIAMRMVRSEHLAQELMQETLLQAFLSLDRLRDDGNFRNWLYGIALNVCRGHIRRRRTRYVSLEAIVGGMRVDERLFSSAPDPAAAAEERDIHRLVLEAVRSLSPKNRRATLLFYYEQLTVREIADLLGTSVGAVKGRLHRSRVQLRSRLLSLHPEITQTMPHQERRSGMIEVTVADVATWAEVARQEEGEPGTEASYTVVVLLDEKGRRFLPIFVGRHEGEAIALSLIDHSIPRPLTFTFMANLLAGAGVELESVLVGTLKEGTYYATARVRSGGVTREVDARPSDAIPLALQMQRPIYVSEAVMKETGIDISDKDTLPTGTGIELVEDRIARQIAESEEHVRAHKKLSKTELEALGEKWSQELIDFVFGTER